MIPASYRFLLGCGLFAAAAIVVVIFPLGLDENAAKPDTSGVKPRIFFDNDPRLVAYQLGRLSNDQLVDVRPDLGVACARRATSTAPNSRSTRVAEGRRGRGVAKGPSLRRRQNAMIGQHSKAGATAQGVSNVATVRKPLHRSRGSAILSGA